MSSSSDEEYLGQDYASTERPNREIPFSSLEVGYKVCKFDRPIPVKEDLIVYVDSGRPKVGYVSKVGFKDDKRTEEGDCRAGTYFHVDEIPSLKLAYVAGYEAITIDRCYSVGETVMAFKNKHEGTSQEKSRCNATSMIGQILAVRTTADVLVLPEKKDILHDVPIDNNYKMLELMNYNSSHNYVLYKEWIGDILEMENEIVCWYYKQRVTLIETSKQESFFRRKGENRRSNKSFIPGETVYVELRFLTSKHSKWESGEAPPALKRKMGKSGSGNYQGMQKVRLVVEKVIPSSVGVKWLQSPSSMVMPDSVIKKEELKNLQLIDVSANPRISSADRMLFTLENEVRKFTKKEYNQWLGDQYKSWFVNPKNAHKARRVPILPPPPLKPVMEEDEEMKSQADDEEEMELDEQATGDNRHKETEDEDEEQKEKVVSAPALRSSNRLKRGRKAARTREREPRKKKSLPAPSQPEPKKREGNWVKGVFCAEVLLSRTVCDVEWMDGTISKDVLGASLVPVDPDLDQQDHLPGNSVAKKSDDEKEHDDSFGIILKVNTEERVANVRWFTLLDKTRMNGGAEFKEDEEVTLFDIMPHPHYKRQFPGYLGISMSKADAMTAPDLNKTCCKIMANLENGKQLVEYMDRTTDELWPMEIMVLPLHEADDDPSDDEMDETDGWQTFDARDNPDDEHQSTAATAGTSTSAASVGGASTPPSTSSAAEGPSTSSSRPSRGSSQKSKKKKKEEEEEVEECVPKSLPMFEKGTLTMLEGEVTTGHKFLKDAVTNPGSKWMKSVMREHAHLREHLPKEIHVWAWEQRLDLMTCIIFGPSGTPFELTPFHFDIHIPEQFPAAPPKVHYYAWSQEQLNPNLYQAGKVCVSLLGTWDGDGDEKWTPTSNLLQVFISIQGLILNAEPYFNEAGYEDRKHLPEHEGNSKRYNESATINSLEYLWRIYDKPPEHLAAVVRKGVDSRFAELKKRVEDWADEKKQPEFPVHSSKGFRLALKTTIIKVASIVNKHQQNSNLPK